MLSLRSSMASPPVLGAMRQPGRFRSHPDPARTLAKGVSVVSAPTSAVDLPQQDWFALFDAVTERLQGLAGRGNAAPGLRQPMQECVDALRQLHQGLEASLEGRTQLRTELAAARAQLARTRAELALTQASRRRAEHAALHDALTQLPNRSHFHERLAGSLAGAGTHASDGTASLAVLFLDLDGFKRINDEHGHDTGDATLRIVAQRLARALRAEDTVCRLGGDEFACLLEAPAGREQLGSLAGKLFDAVAAPLKVGALQLSVQPSIGIAIYPDDGTTGDMLLQRADAAMFHAKRRRQGYAFFERRSEL